jgi:hypothetical protein
MTRVQSNIEIPVDIFGIDPKYLENPSLVADDNELSNIFSQEFASVAGLAAHGKYYLRYRDKQNFLESNSSRYVEPRLPRRKQTTKLHKQLFRLVIALSSTVDLLLVTNTQYTVNSLPNRSPIELTVHAKRWRLKPKSADFYPKYSFSDPQNLPEIGASLPGNMLSFLKVNKPDPTYIEIYQAILSNTETVLNSNKPDPLLLSRFILRSSPELERARQILTAFVNSIVLVNLPISKVYSPGFSINTRTDIITRLINIGNIATDELDKAVIFNKLAENIFTGNYTDDDIDLLKKLISIDPALFYDSVLLSRISSSNELLDKLISSYINVLNPNETIHDLLETYLEESSTLDGALGIPGNYVAAGTVHVLKVLFILNDLTQGIVDSDAFKACIPILVQGIKFINDSKLEQFNMIIVKLVSILNILKQTDIDALTTVSNARFLQLQKTIKAK